MKKISVLLFLLIYLVTGCTTRYVQVFKTNSSDLSENEEIFTFENDSIMISYSFWAEKGLMTFAVFNKLSKPLYIDWKKSAYIDDAVKLNYWEDEETEKTTFRQKSYFYGGTKSSPDFSFNQTNVGVSTSKGTSISLRTKEERITFIPPKTNYFRSQFHLLPKEYYPMGKNVKVSREQMTNKPNQYTEVYKVFFTKRNSPLSFRNW